MLDIKGLTYYTREGGFLFQDVSISIEKGQIIGLKGYSGSGKTTLAKVIAGYLRPTKGEILFQGSTHQPTGINPIQLVWQHPELAINPEWKLKKILTEVGSIDEEILSHLGIREEWLDRYPNELSGGELQRFCLVRALSDSTEYVLADEITTMLDAVTQAQIWHFLKHLVQKKRIGVLAISHDEQLLQAISTKIINLEDFKEQT